MQRLTWNRDKLRVKSCTSNASSALDQICSSCLSDMPARRPARGVSFRLVCSRQEGGLMRGEE